MTADLKTLSKEDFDGHTDFDKLTIEQRLAWLSQIAQIALMSKVISPKKIKPDGH